jgi:hypothetical protein
MQASPVAVRRVIVVLAVAVSLPALVAACGHATRVTTIPKVSKAEAGRIVPDWYVNPPHDEKFLVASGSAISSDMQLALTKAQTVSRATLAEQMQATYKVLTKQFAEEVGRDDSNRLLDQFTRTVEAVVNANLVNTVLRQQYLQQEAPGYRAFVLVAVSRDDLAARLLKELKANEALYTRVRATQAFKDLEAQTAAPPAP